MTIGCARQHVCTVGRCSICAQHPPSLLLRRLLWPAAALTDNRPSIIWRRMLRLLLLSTVEQPVCWSLHPQGAGP